MMQSRGSMLPDVACRVFMLHLIGCSEYTKSGHPTMPVRSEAVFGIVRLHVKMSHITMGDGRMRLDLGM